MNKAQRTTLVIGAVALLIAIFSPPQYWAPGWRIDIGGAVLRILGIIVATLFVAYALKDKKKAQ